MGNLLVTDNAIINHLTAIAVNTVPDRTQSLGAAGAFSNVIITSTGASRPILTCAMVRTTFGGQQKQPIDFCRCLGHRSSTGIGFS